MNLAKTWNSVLGSLEIMLPRVEFNTWLRRTELVYLDGNVAVISTTSPILREAIELRYSSLIVNQLHEILGYTGAVRFIVGPYNGATDTTNGKITTRAPTTGSITNEFPSISDEMVEHAASNGHFTLNTDDREVVPSSGGMPETKVSQRNKEVPDSEVSSIGNNDEHVTALQTDFFTPTTRGMLNPRFKFDRFIIGSSNRLASAASMAVADNPAQAYNPLFLYGGVGLGKTHLLHAIGNAALERNPRLNILYVSSEKFTNDLINSIRRQQTEEFRIRYRSIDILLIDDIQFIAGKDATQEEFFHTFNTLHTAGKQIVVSSDRPPKAILTLEERLRSRFEWGLIVDIQMPDYETRTAILRTKAEQMTVDVPANVIEFLAQRIQSNIRELEGSLNRVVAFAKMNGTSITIDNAQAALNDLLETSRKKRITSDMILRAVCDFYGLELRALQGKGRSRNLVGPRQVAMYLLREETDSSLVDIGAIIGGRDHTTIKYGCDKIGEELVVDTRLRQEINTIRESLYRSQ